MYQLLAVLTLAALADAGCPDGFEVFNMGCYLIGSTSVASYNEAFLKCFNKGGYLWNIDAELENTFISNKLKNDQGDGFNAYWTGGVYDGQSWVWQKTSDWYGVVVKKFMDPDGYSSRAPGWPRGWFDQNNKIAIMRNYGTGPYIQWFNLNGQLLQQMRMGYICEADYKMP